MTRNDPRCSTDDPRPRVRRITLNRPEKRNAMSNRVRRRAVRRIARAPTRTTTSASIVIRGAGRRFWAGYDLDTRPRRAAPAPDRDPRRLLEPAPRRGLVRAHGHVDADHRPGARLLPRGRFGARGGVRPRVRRRRRDDRVPAGAHDVVARSALAAVVHRHAALDGGTAHRRLDDRRRGGRGRVRQPRLPRRRARRARC